MPRGGGRGFFSLARMANDMGFRLGDADAASVQGQRHAAFDLWAAVLDCERRGQYRRASDLLRDCLRQPALDQADVHFHIAWCLEALNTDLDTAFAHYLKAAESATNAQLRSNARYRAALLAYARGDRALATPLLEAVCDAAAIEPGFRTLAEHALYWLGMCREGEERVLDAVALYEEVARKSGTALAAEARYRQLQCQLAIGDFGAALTTVDRLVGLDDGSDRVAQLVRLAREERRQVLQALAHA